MTDPIVSLKGRLGGRSIYLIGMMGSGKTSTGRPLAKRLGYGFVDADAVIEQVANCTIPEIFERDGEEGFRLIESQVLNAISQRHSLVVATGGGVVTNPKTGDNYTAASSFGLMWIGPSSSNVCGATQPKDRCCNNQTPKQPWTPSSCIDAVFMTKLISRWSSKTKHPMTSLMACLLYTSPSPRDLSTSRMPSSA